MSGLAIGIWIVTLVIIGLVIVPVAVALLRRTLKSAWAIERYLADMLAAGVTIVGHTTAVPALETTIETAVAMKPVAESIEAKTGVVAGILATRAEA